MNAGASGVVAAQRPTDLLGRLSPVGGESHDMLVLLGVARAASELQEVALERQAKLEEAVREVERRHEAVRMTGVAMEQAIRAVADEAMKAVIEARDRLLSEAYNATNEKLSKLSSQSEGLSSSIEVLQGRRVELQAMLESGNMLESAKAMVTLQETMEIEANIRDIKPAAEDDLEYRGPDKVQRKEALDRLMARQAPSAASGNGEGIALWGSIKRTAQATTTTSRSNSPMRLPCLRAVGSMGKGEKQFNQPFHLAVDGNRLYVADCGNDRVVVMDKMTLEQLEEVEGTRDSGRLSRPMGVATDDICLYIVETGRVNAVRAVCKATREEVWRTGGDVFTYPHQVVVGSAHVYVADGYDGHVVVLEKETGEHIRTFDATQGFKRILNRFSTGLPHGLALDPEHPRHLYVSYANSRHILVVDQMTGAPIRTFSTTRDVRAGKKGVAKAYGLAVRGRYLYVADYHSHQVQVLDKYTGVHVASPGNQEEGLFSSPTGLAVDGERLFVSDYGSNRVQVFEL